MVRCTPAEELGGACEATQIVAAAGRPIAQVAIGRVDNYGPLRLTLLLPLNVSFSAPAHLSGYGPAWATPPLAFTWTRCLPAGCIAVAEPPPETLRRLMARISPIRLAFLDSGGGDAVVQVSLTGLTRAIALLAETAAKRKSQKGSQ